MDRGRDTKERAAAVGGAKPQLRLVDPPIKSCSNRLLCFITMLATTLRRHTDRDATVHGVLLYNRGCVVVPAPAPTAPKFSSTRPLMVSTVVHVHYVFPIHTLPWPRPNICHTINNCPRLIFLGPINSHFGHPNPFVFFGSDTNGSLAPADASTSKSVVKPIKAAGASFSTGASWGKLLNNKPTDRRRTQSASLLLTVPSSFGY